MFRRLLFIVIFLQGSQIYGHEPYIKFEHITTKDGLSHSWVRCIYRDSYGYMWFGTGNNGINKYDGYNFTLYKNDPKNQNSLSHNSIDVIIEDKKRNLWVGTQDGLNKYDREQDKFIPVTNLYDANINSICEWDNGKFYITTANDLILLDTENDSIFYIINVSENLGYTFRVRGLIKYNNKLFVGTRNGLFSLDPTNNNITAVKKDIDVRSIYQDSKGKLWIGTQEYGLFSMTYENNNPNKPVFKNYRHNPNNKNSIAPGSIVALQEDNNGFLWIGTGNNGIYLKDLEDHNKNKANFYHYTNEPNNNSSLSNDGITFIYKDREGTIWVGTFNGGINYYNKILYKFRSIKQDPNNSNSLNSNNIGVIYEEGNLLWVGTQKGLNILNRKNNRWQHFAHDPSNSKSLGSNSICSIFRDSQKNMWIGTWAGGLNLFNETKKTFTRYLHDDKNISSISNNNIFGISEDKDGTLWIATMGGGLNKFDYETNTFKKYTNNPNDETSISSDWVKIVLENHYGEIWIATSAGADLLKKKEEVFYRFRHDGDNPNSISTNSIITLFEDSKNNLWFVTENGLNIFNRNSNNFSFYTEEDGLPNNIIRGVCEDDHGNLWISTNKGISKFINGINRPESPVFRNYDASDGLPGNEFNSRSCFKVKDGKMYFGGNHGLAVFHPDSVKENPNKPEIIFSDFLIFNKSVAIGEKDSPLSNHISLTKEIVLSYNQSVISIHYAGLNYLAPEKCKFAFMLEGFEKEWNYVGNKREATYTNLDPGKYIFRVKGSNNDGVWNEEGTSLKIIITPPFWMTIWFRLIMIVLIILAVYTIHLVKVRNIVEYGRKLEIKVAERTKDLQDFAYIVSHDLKAPLRGINELSGWIYEDYNKLLDKEGKENLKLLKGRTAKMNSMIQGILEYSRVGRTELKTETIDLNNLVEGIIDLLAAPKNIKITIEDKLPEYTANKTRLGEVFQNIISNAIKYIDKPKGIIKISCTDEGNQWKFGISDNGPGIEEKHYEEIFKIFQMLDSTPKEGSTGIGLTIVKKIIDLYEGRIWVESEIGKGTTFYFTLPKQ